jgi:hypothetical protein
MEPGEFITFASRTVTQGKAGARSAISRAYYGAFHASRRVLQELAAEVPRSAAAHNLLPQFFQAVNHPSANAAATLLSGLHGERIKADYQLTLTSIEETAFAKLMVESAVETQNHLGAFHRDCRADARLLQEFRDGVARVKSVHQA